MLRYDRLRYGSVYCTYVENRLRYGMECYAFLFPAHQVGTLGYGGTYDAVHADGARDGLSSHSLVNGFRSHHGRRQKNSGEGAHGANTEGNQPHTRMNGKERDIYTEICDSEGTPLTCGTPTRRRSSTTSTTTTKMIEQKATKRTLPPVMVPKPR